MNSRTYLAEPYRNLFVLSSYSVYRQVRKKTGERLNLRVSAKLLKCTCKMGAGSKQSNIIFYDVNLPKICKATIHGN
jgi:hypothetical protein